jgi:hypothetical protein
MRRIAVTTSTAVTFAGIRGEWSRDQKGSGHGQIQQSNLPTNFQIGSECHGLKKSPLFFATGFVRNSTSSQAAFKSDSVFGGN